MFDVVTNLHRIQGWDEEVRSHPLCKLLQLGALQQVPELRLAHQDDLQQLVLVGVDVGEHAQRLHGGRAEVLGLIDDQHHPPSLSVLVDKKPLERVIPRHRRRNVMGQPEGQHDPFGQVGKIRVGIGDQAHHDLLTQIVEKSTDQRGLATTDVATDHRETGSVVQCVLQHGVGERVPLAHVKKVGIGLNGEGFFLQSVKRFIHVWKPRFPWIRSHRRFKLPQIEHSSTKST